jgi:hypothetical protein
MSYLVTVTFDLHEVPEEAWEEVYKAAYTALAKIGLTHIATPERPHSFFIPLRYFFRHMLWRLTLRRR